MNTNDQIAWLVEHGGFTLPDGLWTPVASPGRIYWSLGEELEGREHVIADQLAHDLCAMAFARVCNAHPVLSRHPLAVEEAVDGHMARGDSARAIAALYEALQS